MANVKWISHRGYCAAAVENTQNAFDAAVALGFHHLETDLRLSRDGHIVLHHDANLRSTCQKDIIIERTLWNELREIKTQDGQTLLGLYDIVGRYSESFWTFDIKPPLAVQTLRMLFAWQKEEKVEEWMKRHVRFLLWSGEAEREARRLFPDIEHLAQEKECYRAGLAVLTGCSGLAGIRPQKIYSLPSHFQGISLFSKRMVEAYKRRGAHLLAYLPKDDDLAKLAYSLGFDEILTNGIKPLTS